MLLAGYGDLAGGASQKLLAGEFFHQIGIDGAGLQKLDAMLEALAFVGDAGELFLRDRETRTRIGEREKTARAANRVVAEIRDRGRADSRNDHCTEKPRDAVSDSHEPNESQSDSQGQAETVARGFLFHIVMAGLDPATHQSNKRFHDGWPPQGRP